MRVLRRATGLVRTTATGEPEFKRPSMSAFKAAGFTTAIAAKVAGSMQVATITFTMVTAAAGLARPTSRLITGSEDLAFAWAASSSRPWFELGPLADSCQVSARLPRGIGSRPRCCFGKGCWGSKSIGLVHFGHF